MRRKIVFFLISLSIIVLVFFAYIHYKEKNKELADGDLVSNIEISTGDTLNSSSIVSGELNIKWPESLYSAGYVIYEDTIYLLIYKTKDLVSNKEFEVNFSNNKNEIQNIQKIVVSYTDLKNRNGFSESEFPNFKNTVVWEKSDFL